MILKQAPYKCLEHQIDLTGQVREKLQGSGLGAADPTGSEPPEDTDRVRCPVATPSCDAGQTVQGAELCPGTGDAQPHELVVTGTYQS